MPRVHPISSSAASWTLALACISGQAALADVTLTSADGRWVATIEDTGGAAGQCTSLKDMTAAPEHQQFLHNTRHYVRMGTSISWVNAVSQRMENIFSLLSFANSSNTYTATLSCNTVPGLLAIVHGEMISGVAGGMRVSISFTDTDPSDVFLAQYSVKPFVYANLNVDNQMLNNVGSWSTDHYHQSANNTGTGNVRWFLGRDPAAHASTHDSFMEGALDNGVQELSNVSWLGPGDINTAMSFAAATLSEGVTHTTAYALGNQNITIPAAFGLPPNAGGVGIHSNDGRWTAIVRTGMGTTDFGSAGEIDSVMDFEMPASSARFASLATYYLGINQGTSFLGSKVKDTFKRIAFFYPTETTSMASAVLNSELWPGLVLTIDAKMIAGGNGGLVVSMKYADTLNRGLNIAPIVFADIDADNQAINAGGFDTDHFYQTAGKGPARWFRAQQNSFSSYESGLTNSLQGTLNSGIVALANTVNEGPVNLGAAFAFHPWPLDNGSVYHTGYALGDAGIIIPTNFVLPSVWSACPADVAPAPQGDGQVDVDDLISVILGWGTCAPASADCAADIVPTYLGDGFVDVDDLIEVILSWGACFPK